METIGIKDTQEVIRFGTALGVALNKALKDGLTFTDISHAAELLPYIQPALDGVSNVGVELADLSQGELDQLKTVVIDILGKESYHKSVEVAEAAITAAVAIWDLMIIIKRDDAELPDEEL